MTPVLVTCGAGWPLVMLDDLPTGLAEAVPTDVALVRGSVGDAALVGRTLRRRAIGAVIHLVGSLVVGESVVRPPADRRDNVCHTLGLAEGCLAARVRRLPRAPACRRRCHCRRRWLAAERLPRDATATHGLDLVALRYVNVAGVDPAKRAGQRNRRATHLVKLGCEAAPGPRDVVPIFGRDDATPDGTSSPRIRWRWRRAEPRPRPGLVSGRGGAGSRAGCRPSHPDARRTAPRRRPAKHGRLQRPDPGRAGLAPAP